MQKDINTCQTITDLKTIIPKLERYKNFTIFDSPIKFKDVFHEDINIVQLHSIETFDTSNGKDIVGFCGVFSFVDNKIQSLDGDCYSENPLVFGYYIWQDKENGTNTVDILVGDDW